MQNILIIMGMLLLVGSFTTGCDDSILEGLADDDSFEARLEEARIALDNGDYARAVELLEALESANPGNALVLEYLSNAYAGLAGLDTFNLLSTIDLLDDQSNSGSIDMIGLVLGDSDGILTTAELQTKIANLEDGISTLRGISNPSNDQKIQLGLLAVAHMSLTVGNIVAADQGSSNVTLTEEGIERAYGSQPAEFSDVPDATKNLSGLTEDLGYISDAVTALDGISGEQNDLAQDFSQFQNDIDNNGDGAVSEDDLEDYVNNEI